MIYFFVCYQPTVSAMKQSFDQCLHHAIIPWGIGASALFSYINVLNSFRDYATKYLYLNNQVETQARNSSQDNNHLIWAESLSEFLNGVYFSHHTPFILLIFDSGSTFLNVLCIEKQRRPRFNHNRHLVRV